MAFKRDAVRVLFGAMLGYGILFVLPSPLGLVIVTPLIWKYKTRNPLMLGLILGAGIRISVILLLGILLLACPSWIPFFSRNEIARVLSFGGDIGAVYEGIVRFHTLKAHSDPFTGMPYRREGNTFYSVGPSGVDVGALILYDPTNGLTSKGSIFLHEENR